MKRSQIPSVRPVTPWPVSRTSAITYTAQRLYNIRRMVPKIRLDPQCFTSIRSLGLLRLRGCRAGRHKVRYIHLAGGFNRRKQLLRPTSPRCLQTYSSHNPAAYRCSSKHRNIPVVNTTYNRQQLMRPTIQRCLQPLPRYNPAVNSLHSLNPLQSIPRMYLLNAASIAKPHAIESLAIELNSFSIDIAIISESHLKKHHADPPFNITGYNLLRRDRVKRKCGGVCMYVKNNLAAQIITPPKDIRDYEVMWVEIEFNQRKLICAAVYHPPHPIYNSSTFMDNLVTNIEHFLLVTHYSSMIMCGDFNQLSDQELCLQTGLLSVVTEPTRASSALDRMYISCDLNVNLSVKVFKSTVKSDHCAIIVNNDNMPVINTIKEKKVMQYRARSPAQHAAFLSNVQNYSFNSFMTCNEVQECADTLYKILNNLLDLYYPRTSITLTNQDPSFITPEIKNLLRKKNSLMRKGKQS